MRQCFELAQNKFQLYHQKDVQLYLMNLIQQLFLLQVVDLLYIHFFLHLLRLVLVNQLCYLNYLQSIYFLFFELHFGLQLNFFLLDLKLMYLLQLVLVLLLNFLLYHFQHYYNIRHIQCHCFQVNLWQNLLLQVLKILLYYCI